MQILVVIFFLLAIHFPWQVAAGYVVFLICGCALLLALDSKPSKPQKPPSRDSTKKLAREVALLLEHGMRIVDVHRDACGEGLAYIDGTYIFDDVQDGIIDPPGQFYHYNDTRIEFSDKESFIQWLDDRLASRPAHSARTSDINFARVLSFVQSYYKHYH